MLFLKRLTSTKACDSVLRRAILSNSLVNPHGRRDTWQEVDRSLEYLNLELKRELWTRRTSTFGLDALFKTTSLTAEYTVCLRKAIERAFARQGNSTHSVPCPVDDIQYWRSSWLVTRSNFMTAAERQDTWLQTYIRLGSRE